MISRLLLFVLSVSAIAFGQVSAPSGSVTVTATLGQNVQPDQTTFLITIQSPITTSLDDLMGALQGSGLTLASFSNVYSVQQYANNGKPANLLLEWNFQLAVPLAGMKSEVAALLALVTSLGQGQTPLTLSYQAQGTQVSNQAQVQSCGFGDLFSAVVTKAQQIAGAANQKAGGVTALSSSVNTQIGPAATTPYVIPSCSLTAMFGPVPQTASSITVTASRTVNVPADLIVVAASVTTPAVSTVDDALAVLPGTGLAASNLSSLYSPSPGILQWQFSLSVPFAKMKDTLAVFQKAASPAVSFAVQGPQVSSQLLAAQDCSYASLLNDAQAQARQVTAAARVALGGIVAIADNNYATPVYRLGDFSQLNAVYDPLTAVITTVPSQSLTCSLTVQFGISQP